LKYINENIYYVLLFKIITFNCVFYSLRQDWIKNYEFSLIPAFSIALKKWIEQIQIATFNYEITSDIINI